MSINPYKMCDPSPPYRLEHLSWMNTTFGGVPIQQTWSALFMLGKLIEEEEIKIILELGTGKGGLTKFFMNYAPTYTYDLPLYDVFSEKAKKEIKHILKWNKNALVFCDDGDKPRELMTYAPMLKVGDHILVHDYKRPDGVSWSDGERAKMWFGLIEYRQYEFDELQTYILSLKKV